MRCDECIFKAVDGIVKCRFGLPDSDPRILVGCTTIVEDDPYSPVVVPVYINKIVQLKKGGVDKDVSQETKKD